jgi:phosphatidate cytidylyltransferase
VSQLAAAMLAGAPAVEPDKRITDNNVFNWLFASDLDGMSMKLGSMDIVGRGVWFFYIATTILLLTGVVLLFVRKRELTDKWVTWAALAVLVGIPLWIGKLTTLPVVVILATVAVWEFNRLVKLPKPEQIILHTLAVAYPLAAYFSPDLLNLVPFFALVCALPAVLQGDVDKGIYRASMAMFGSIWICWSLSFLVVIWKDSFFVIFAVAAADVGAWCGGKLLKRYAWARRGLSPLSPNKTIGGLVGGLVLSALMMCLLGSISVGLILAIGLGSVAGDLLQSMVKRHAKVKDSGQWLPGFGGILDRIDSWLLAFPLAATIGAFL